MFLSPINGLIQSKGSRCYKHFVPNGTSEMLGRPDLFQRYNATLTRTWIFFGLPNTN